MKLEFEGVRFCGTRVVMVEYEFEFAKKQEEERETFRKALKIQARTARMTFVRSAQ